MVFAAYNDTGFKVVLLLHILSVLVAFGPLFVAAPAGPIRRRRRRIR